MHDFLCTVITLLGTVILDYIMSVYVLQLAIIMYILYCDDFY